MTLPDSGALRAAAAVWDALKTSGATSENGTAVMELAELTGMSGDEVAEAIRTLNRLQMVGTRRDPAHDIVTINANIWARRGEP